MSPANASANSLLNKVPAVTLIFWIIKILSTTVGETGADYLIFKLHFGLPLTSVLMSAVLVLAIAIQLRADRYVPWKYWLAVVLVSIVGTLICDSLVDTYGVSLVTTTVLFSVALLVTFSCWYASEKSLSILSIYRGQREYFYWLAILVTFALGTAAGDLLGEEMGLGYAVSALLFAAAIGVVAIAHYLFGLNPVATFWIAYILTRPFGASCGDWLSHSVAKGGLGLGTVGTSEIFLVVIIALVGYLSWQQRAAQRLESVG